MRFVPLYACDMAAKRRRFPGETGRRSEKAALGAHSLPGLTAGYVDPNPIALKKGSTFAAEPPMFPSPAGGSELERGTDCVQKCAESLALAQHERGHGRDQR